MLADGTDEFAVLAVNVGSVAEDFRDAHVGDVFSPDDSLLSGGLHLGASEAEEGGVGVAPGELVDDLGAVVVSGCFAGGDEDAWRGVACGAHSVVPPPSPSKVRKVFKPKDISPDLECQSGVEAIFLSCLHRQ